MKKSTNIMDGKKVKFKNEHGVEVVCKVIEEVNDEDAPFYYVKLPKSYKVLGSSFKILFKDECELV